jgi:hypothetical protein
VQGIASFFDISQNQDMVKEREKKGGQLKLDKVHWGG